MCLSVYVGPHLPRVRSLRIFDSLRAIIAFRILLDTQTDSFYKRKTRIKQQKMDLPNDNRSLEEIIKEI